MAHAHFFAGRHDEAVSWARMALRELPDSHGGLRLLLQAARLLGVTGETETSAAFSLGVGAVDLMELLEDERSCSGMPGPVSATLTAK